MNPQELFEHNRTAYEAVMNHFGEAIRKYVLYTPELPASHIYEEPKSESRKSRYAYDYRI